MTNHYLNKINKLEEQNELLQNFNKILLDEYSKYRTSDIIYNSIIEQSNRRKPATELEDYEIIVEMFKLTNKAQANWETEEEEDTLERLLIIMGLGLEYMKRKIVIGDDGND